MIDEKIKTLFNVNSVHYPHELARQYPRMLNRIVELWDAEEIDAYFSELILDTRDDQRKGFPAEVAEEIIRLSVINTKYREHRKPHSWSRVPEKDRVELASLGYKYTDRDYFTAAKTGNFQAVHIFLRTKVDVETPDEQGWTALTHAAACGQDTIIALLIRSRAKVNNQDRNGYSALHWAAFHGHLSTAKLLLENQANVNACSKLGWTPLIQAATQGHTLVVALLISAGAEVNAISNDHWTALQKSSANGHAETVKFLLSKGADSTVERHNGSTALSLSATGKHKAIFDILSSVPRMPTTHKPDSN